MNENKQTGCLYLVATPIGNLDDMTFRAVQVLKEVDVIAAEDTRHSHKLLKHYNITTRTLSLHNFNEALRSAELIKRLKMGTHIALIADAGTPLICDPGYRVVEMAHRQGIKVIPIPGACAAIAGLVASGLPTDQFIFLGFLPAKGAVRKKRLEMLQNEPRTMIFYESVHRIVNLIDMMCEVFGGDRVATLARELTKTFETIRQCNLHTLKKWLETDSNQSKGEFVIVLQGAHKKITRSVEENKHLLKILLSKLALKQAVSLATEITGEKRKILYSLALAIQKKTPE